MDAKGLSGIIEALNSQEGFSFTNIENDKNEYIAIYESNVDPVGLLRMAFPLYFPTELPEIHVVSPPKEALHIDSEGKLCLFTKSSMLIDIRNPVGIIIECIKRAIVILSLQPGTSEYQSELRREFLSYWGKNSKVIICSALDLGEVDFIEVPILEVTNKYYVLSHSIVESRRILHDVLRVTQADNASVDKALIIRLRDDAELPSPFKNMSGQAISNYLRTNIPKPFQKKFIAYWRKQIRKKETHRILIVATISSVDGYLAFGFAMNFTLMQQGKQRKAETISVPSASCHALVERIDYNHMVSRAGAEPLLRGKRVLLLGCGSVGGFLANNLCQLGVTELDLVDNDMLSFDNIHRHFLGADTVCSKGSRNKADLMRDQLIDKYMYVEIDTLNYERRDVASVLFPTKRWEDYDMVISALGEPTLNLEINRRMRNDGSSTPFIVCFNEPYGIGGHVIVSNLNSDSCLQCLYSANDAGELGFRGSFVEHGQSFEKSLSGCFGTFVPYSSLHSQQTAIYAANTSAKVLTGQIKNNCLISWKSDDDALLVAGFRTSDRFREVMSGITIVEDIKSEYCYVCASRRIEVPNDI